MLLNLSSAAVVIGTLRVKAWHCLKTIFFSCFSCIDKWLKGQGGKCPHCNAKAKRQDIRVIYAKSIKVNLKTK